MTWGPEELGDVAANRDVAFPPLHAEHDPGNIETRFTVTVPFMVNGARFSDLLASLKRWVEDQGLADYIDPGGISLTAMHAAMVREEGE